MLYLAMSIIVHMCNCTRLFFILFTQSPGPDNRGPYNRESTVPCIIHDKDPSAKFLVFTGLCHSLCTC